MMPPGMHSHLQQQGFPQQHGMHMSPPPSPQPHLPQPRIRQAPGQKSPSAGSEAMVPPSISPGMVPQRDGLGMHPPGLGNAGMEFGLIPPGMPHPHDTELRMRHHHHNEELRFRAEEDRQRAEEVERQLKEERQRAEVERQLMEERLRAEGVQKQLMEERLRGEEVERRAEKAEQRIQLTEQLEAARVQQDAQLSAVTGLRRQLEGMSDTSNLLENERKHNETLISSEQDRMRQEEQLAKTQEMTVEQLQLRIAMVQQQQCDAKLRTEMFSKELAGRQAELMQQELELEQVKQERVKIDLKVHEAELQIASQAQANNDLTKQLAETEQHLGVLQGQNEGIRGQHKAVQQQVSAELEQLNALVDEVEKMRETVDDVRGKRYGVVLSVCVA